MNLDEIRKEIDEVDRELTRLFVRRMKLVGEVACYKKEHGKQVFDKSREAAVKSKIKELSGAEFAEYADELYSTLFEVSRAYQHSLIGSAPSLSEEPEDTEAVR